MAKDKSEQDAPGATWTLLTHLLDLLADKHILTSEDLLALAEAAHGEMAAQGGKRGGARLKGYRDKVKARGAHTASTVPKPHRTKP
jgi:hypothetical protein